MKKIEAFVRHEAFDKIRRELLKAGIPSITVSDVKGSGRERGVVEHYRGAELVIHLRPKLKIECVVDDADVDIVVETILNNAQTGEIGDGKIFIIPVDDTIRIRSGERGQDVLGRHNPQSD